VILAFTGATGFIGSHLVDLALADGHRVRALTRRLQPPRAGVTWIDGTLDRADSLARLVDGTDATIHVAGVLNAADRAGFVAGNITGTRTLLGVLAPDTRFVHVSSLAAREPDLSDYGWSKAQTETVVAASPTRWTIVRPPGVFGARDTEMRELFRFAARGVVPLPPAGGRASVIHAPELARLLLVLATGDGALGQVIEPDDGEPSGWDHRALGRAIADAVGRRALVLPLPRPLLALASAIDRRWRGASAKLTRDRLSYLSHPDWVSRLRPDPSLWSSRTDTRAALRETALWYRAHGLL
jgi:uncharacterized protein YbjT (DUF2867 family)